MNYDDYQINKLQIYSNGLPIQMPSLAPQAELRHKNSQHPKNENQRTHNQLPTFNADKSDKQKRASTEYIYNKDGSVPVTDFDDKNLASIDTPKFSQHQLANDSKLDEKEIELLI